ncbi:MAG: RNA polymerase sigma factor SigJ [Sphingomonadales bacterium]|jgi:RNA polymerase sigma-70 factor (ECF subfamily)
MPHKSHHAELFNAERSVLIGLAYRMLGERGEAEDIVQEAYIRWMRVDLDTIKSSRAWLIRATSRLCIDRLRALKRQRDIYEGPWLPEPWMETDPANDLEADENLAESLRLAFLLLLERMSATERAAFLLREAFDLSYAEISNVLEKSEGACRQLVSRAKRRIGDKPNINGHQGEELSLMEAFVSACASGDLEQLKGLLSENAQLHSDGGGKRLAARNVIYSADHVARFILGVLKQTRERSGLKVERATINQAPGMLISDDDGLQTAMVLEGHNGRIQDIYMQRNPDKLAMLCDLPVTTIPS